MAEPVTGLYKLKAWPYVVRLSDGIKLYPLDGRVIQGSMASLATELYQAVDTSVVVGLSLKGGTSFGPAISAETPQHPDGTCAMKFGRTGQK
ncbi:hypothetical protein PCASD_18852 [Puccinia coronata f. sp. avenae]|uniref:Uncharacterized protein n=1 Tax=Puccinia coronata f. sp. avenae TaxID=200324 RepID=A0A2N5TMT3_9BASI|nr:hypothetical protein PCASD_18852 [Puccinia coronata f. sp. avenae]